MAPNGQSFPKSTALTEASIP
jgi:hypothetical protein